MYAGPGVYYANYDRFPPPATSIPSSQINNINTLTISHNVSLSGATDQFDASSGSRAGGQRQAQDDLVYAARISLDRKRQADAVQAL